MDTEKLCMIVRDLIPLYEDNVCSPESAALVREHTEKCDACRKLLQDMGNNQAVMLLETEKRDAVLRLQKAARRRSIAGNVVVGVLALPVLICLIVVLSMGRGGGWFAILLSSLLVAASLTAVPLLVQKNRGLWTLGTFTVSLMALLGVCCAVTGGRWFGVAALSTLFGLSVFLLPFAANAQPIRERLGKYRGLFVMGVDTLLFAAMLLAIGFYVRDPMYAYAAPRIGGAGVLAAWVQFLLCRYLPGGGFVKAGVSCILWGGAIFSANRFFSRVLDGAAMPWPIFEPGMHTADNVLWYVLLGGLALGLLFILIGVLRRKGRK